MLRTRIKWTVDGESFGDNEATLLAERPFGWAAFHGDITRETNVGALRLALRYRLI